MRRSIIINLVLFLIIILSGCSTSNEKEYEILVKLGKEALSNERYEDAISSFTKALEISPKKEVTNLLLKAKEEQTKISLKEEIEEEVEENNITEVIEEDETVVTQQANSINNELVVTDKYFFDYTVDEMLNILNVKYELELTKDNFDIREKFGKVAYIFENANGMSFMILKSEVDESIAGVYITMPNEGASQYDLLMYTVLTSAFVEIANQGFTFDTLLSEMKKNIIDYESYASSSLIIENTEYELYLDETEYKFSIEDYESFDRS